MSDINPYHIHDGKWGGFGPPSWFNFPWGRRNVYETSIAHDGDFVQRFWLKCWDDEAQRWREITDEERAQLPQFERTKRMTFGGLYWDDAIKQTIHNRRNV